MKGAQTTLYFSWWHDSDLIALYHQIGRKAFIKVMKEALRVLVRVDYEPTFTKSLNISPTMSMQNDENIEEKDEDIEDNNKSLSLIVSFSSAKDVDILNLLYSIKPRKMSIFIKKAMRFLIGPYYILGCMLEGDTKLNNAYLDRKLFFVNSNITNVVTKSEKPKKVKEKKSKKEDKEIVEESTDFASSMKIDSQPSNLIYNEQVEILDVSNKVEGESNLIDDDDILSILENM